MANTITFCLIHSKEINHPIGSNLNNRMNKAFKKANYIIANSNFTKDLSIKLALLSALTILLFKEDPIG